MPFKDDNTPSEIIRLLLAIKAAAKKHVKVMQAKKSGKNQKIAKHLRDLTVIDSAEAREPNAKHNVEAFIEAAVLLHEVEKTGYLRGSGSRGLYDKLSGFFEDVRACVIREDQLLAGVVISMQNIQAGTEMLGDVYPAPNNTDQAQLESALEALEAKADNKALKKCYLVPYLSIDFLNYPLEQPQAANTSAATATPMDNRPCPNNTTALRVAVEAIDVDRVKFLLQHGASIFPYGYHDLSLKRRDDDGIDAGNLDNYSVLSLAIDIYEEAVSACKEFGIDAAAVGRRAIHKKNCEQMITALIEHLPNQLLPLTGKLLAVAHRDYNQILVVLIVDRLDNPSTGDRHVINVALGVDLPTLEDCFNTPDSFNRTALWYATDENDEDGVADLLARGATELISGSTFLTDAYLDNRPVIIQKKESPEDASIEKACEALAALSPHPHIVTMVGQWVTGNLTALFTQGDGITLSRHLRDSDYEPDLNVTLSIGIQVTRALQHLFENGFMHGALTTDAILIQAAGDDAEPMVQLGDFGSAEHFDGDHAKSIPFNPALADALPPEWVIHAAAFIINSASDPITLTQATKAEIYIVGLIMHKIMHPHDWTETAQTNEELLSRLRSTHRAGANTLVWNNTDYPDTFLTFMRERVLDIAPDTRPLPNDAADEFESIKTGLT